MTTDIVNEAVPEFMSGSGTIGQTPQALGTGTVRKFVVIRATGTNTNGIAIGITAANAINGFVLGKGETSPPIYVDDLSKVFIVGGAADQGYSWIAV
jgi:hypothetical protein